MNNAQYLNEVQKALENDDTRLGDVWRLVQEGKSSGNIAKELGHTDKKPQFVDRTKECIQAIEKGVLPFATWMAGYCSRVLRSFIERHREDFSSETIEELEKRATECDRRANNRQVVQRITKLKKETSQAEEALEKSDIAGIYVYTYPQYYNKGNRRSLLKIGLSEKDAFKRVMQQTTGMPERPKILQIWVAENDGDLREIEKKIHDHLRKAGHADHSNEGREWFLTNEQFLASTANLIGLKLHYEHNPEMDD